MIPYTPESYELLHQGTIALAQVEAAGIRVDEDYLKKTFLRLERRMNRLIETRLKPTEIWRKWEKTYQKKMNLWSNDQLGFILFEVLKHPCESRTATGKYKTDEKALNGVDDPFVKDYLHVKKIANLKNTFLSSIQREIVDGFMHPVFNLHLVKTFRSSSDSPNFQNIPVRDKQIGKTVRQAIIARSGHRLVELDYSGIEVAIAACYHKDATMLEYLRNPEKDMHRDMAMECFKIPLEQMTPHLRYLGKNMFVFPQFYGDYYVSCARNLWDAAKDSHLKDGTPLIEHLRQKGFVYLGTCDPREKPVKGTFEHHIQKVENRFWNERFPVYNRWKKEWYADYLRNGRVLTHTGFICQGLYARNKVINYPVQGSAFHCLLFSLIRLQKELKKHGMRSIIIGQIHDSIVADVPKDELEDFLALARKVMVTDLKREWTWIIAPIEIEAEVTPVDGNWHQKEPINIKEFVS